MTDIKLSKRENEIIWKLQNGWIFVTGEDFGAILTKGMENEQIRLDVFFRLVDKRLIFQETKRWNYVLTHLGETIKTKSK